MPTPYTGASPLPVQRRESFCIGIMNGLTQREAFVQAGYTGSVRTGAWQIAKHPDVKKRIEYLRGKTADRVVLANAVTRSEIVESVRARRLKADTGVELMTKEGKPSGVCKPDFAAGNRADEILAKMHGFMLDVQKSDDFDGELDNMGTGEVQQLFLGLIDQLDPNARKMFVDRLKAEKPSAEPPAAEAGTEEPTLQ